MLTKRKKKTGKWFPKNSVRRRVLWFLSCLVVFCTTYALILPAITLANETYCNLEEHQHDENCYRISEPICDLESGSEESDTSHEHTDDCYISALPQCGQEEHEHSKMCYSNLEDVEKEEDWEKTLPDKLDGTPRENLAAIAKSQIGYRENDENFVIDEEGNLQNYSRYGEWYGKPHEDWNLMFLSFLLHYAKISDIPYGNSWREWNEDLEKAEIEIQQPEELKEGDVVLFHEAPDPDEESDTAGKTVQAYAGIISSQDPVRVVAGDWNGKVKELDVKKDNLTLDGKISIEDEELSAPEITEEILLPVPDAPDSNDVSEVSDEKLNSSEMEENKAEEVRNDSETVKLPEELFRTETDDFVVEVKPILQNKNADISDPEAELNKTETKDKTSIDPTVENSENEKVFDQNETSETKSSQIRMQLLETAPESGTANDSDILDEKSYELQFVENEEVLDLDGYSFQISMTPKDEYLRTNLEKANEEPDTHIEEIEIEVTSQSVDLAANVLNENSDENSGQSVVPYNLEEEKEPVTIFSASPRFTARTGETSNYSFTVQTYGYLQSYESTEQEEAADRIRAYDQSGLEKSDDMNFYPLVPEGSFYKLKTKTELTKIYTDGNYLYHNAPNLNYFNKLIDNAAYRLKEIWVLKEGTNPNSINRGEWEIYSNPAEVKFLNRAPRDPNNMSHTIVISEGTVIRLVFDPIKADYESPTQYFDYDQTDGKVYTHYDKDSFVTKRNDTKDGGLGINSKENYSSNPGAENRYAFGNANTGISNNLINAKFNGRFLNRGNKIDESEANAENTNYSVFNMVTGLDAKGNPVFDQNIGAPDIFGDTAIPGKTIVTEKSYLGFKRLGDTYTLSSSQIGSYKNWKILNISPIRDNTVFGPITSGRWIQQITGWIRELDIPMPIIMDI